jgi:chromosome segregation ATPase
MHSLKRNLKGIIVTSQKTPIHSKPEAEPQSNDLKPFPVRFKAYEPSKVKQVFNCFTNSKKSKTKSKKPHHLKSLSLADSFTGLEAEIDSYLEQRPKTRKFPDNFSKKVKELEGILDKKEEIIENLRQKTCELESKLSNHENSADPLRNWVKDRFVNLFSNEVAVKNQENASELRTELEKERAKNKDLQNLYDKSLENNKVLTERLEKLEDLLSSFNQRQTGSIEGKENVFLEKLTKENKDLFNQLIKNSDQLFEVKLE